MTTCYCLSGFYMTDTGECVDINECTDGGIVCQNGGTCHNNAGSYECWCAPGWSGTHCERDINECAFMVCMNGGTCQNTPGSFTCVCKPGWTGRNCELDVNECLTPGTCSVNATCTNTVGSYLCTCNEGLVGNGVDCHLSRGPVLLPPNATDISGRMVLVTWVPEEHFEPLQYVVEIDVTPFDTTFQVDMQRFAYGPIVRTLVDGLTPNTEMRFRLKAVNSFGVSPASNVITLKTNRKHLSQKNLKKRSH